MNNKKHIEGGVCAPLGFKACGVAADINGKGNQRKDLALIVSDVPAVAAGVFTQSEVKAAPVLVSQEVLKNGQLQAIVINSRNANCCTGKAGIEDARQMCAFAADSLKIEKENIAVSSTGLIGVPLPMERIREGIRDASKVLSREGFDDAASAIMTTDTFAKQVAVQITIGDTSITIGGMAKGSGMIHPHMATTLSFITTDAKISHTALQKALNRGDDNSFNMINVDGDTSTNDMVLIMANGKAENSEIQIDSPEFEDFSNALEYVLIFLAKEVIRDGEGATKLLEVNIAGARTKEEARLAARAISSSLLVKVSIFACDANWGRILCALGYSGAHFDPFQVTLYIGDIRVMDRGMPVRFDEQAALKVMSQVEVVIKADLHAGNFTARGWGCDLSYDYIKISGTYRKGQTSKKIIVIKCGGAALQAPEYMMNMMQDIAQLKQEGMDPIVVHGGGPEISALSEKLGIKPEFIEGVRVTSAEILSIVQMVLIGKVNKQLVGYLNAQGVPAIGLSGYDGNLLIAKKLESDKGTDLGFVGEVDRVNSKLLRILIEEDYIPVIAPVAPSLEATAFNINADSAACEIAVALGASHLIFLADVPGVLKGDTRIDSIFPSQVRELIKEGTIRGGMIPKTEAAVAALEKGVGQVHIVDGRVPHALVTHLQGKPQGTLFKKEEGP